MALDSKPLSDPSGDMGIDSGDMGIESGVDGESNSFARDGYVEVSPEV
jgi:hypothetical protein